jgi:hypothetical protein
VVYSVATWSAQKDGFVDALDFLIVFNADHGMFAIVSLVRASPPDVLDVSRLSVPRVQVLFVVSPFTPMTLPLSLGTQTRQHYRCGRCSFFSVLFYFILYFFLSSTVATILSARLEPVLVTRQLVDEPGLDADAVILHGTMP